MSLKLVLLVCVTVMLTEALPRYIAIPLEDVRMVPHVRSAPVYPRLVRHVRSAPMYTQAQTQPQPRPSGTMIEARSDGSEPQQADGSDRYERQAVAGYVGGSDHVDYGAYTGGYGAFGWYTDHPVCINCGYYGYH
ncbi:uncharacterized protein [Cherax quadricarinatus]|uniref:uncharacterized protein n=1 Tax=Cherax quadricarinatus TaxID=27406 RepID=UPI002379A95E|nr:uncharacterized protein LOC128700260 [Cherax quadricarinatus]